MKVVGLGAGGHAKVVLEIIRHHPDYEAVGLLAPDVKLWGRSVLGVPVLGGDDLLARLHEQGIRHAFIGVGSTRSSPARARLYEACRALGFTLPPLVHPSAVVSPTARIGDGVCVGAGAVINPDAEIGENAIINTGAIVEHDCRIGPHAHIAPGARLAGGVWVGAGSHVGLGACVLQGVCIGAGATVGAGAVVIRDVPAGATAAGVPARVLSGPGSDQS